MTEKRKRPGPKPGPRDKSAARTVAGLLMLGATQKEAAEAAGVGERTIRDWIKAPWWSEFEEEALSSIDRKLLAFSHRALLSAVRDGDANIALRLVEKLRPDVFGAKGASVRVERGDGDEGETRAVVTIAINQP